MRSISFLICVNSKFSVCRCSSLMMPLAAWLAVFFTANAIYFPLSEEPGLARRFGEDYTRYKANVPRWLPRLKPWRQA